MSQTKRLVLALVAFHYFGGSFVSVGNYLQRHLGVDLIDKPSVKHRLYQLDDPLW